MGISHLEGPVQFYVTNPVSRAYTVGHLDKRLPLPPSLSTLECPARPPHALLPTLPSGPTLLDDYPIVTVAHVALVGLADATGDEERGRVQQHELEDGVVVGHLPAQDLGQDLGVLGGLLVARHVGERVVLRDDGLAVALSVAPPPQPPHVGRARAADLVELLDAADHHGLVDAGHPERLEEDGTQLGARDAQDPGLEDGAADARIDRVGQGADEVEERPPRKLLAYRGDVAHAGVEYWGEEEGVVGLGVDL
ncbi:uncharacterized protein PgNI_09588 [Pyricularia grisea]|uniref:Uncharacterized protein n=1 Tax=Pyricularia grisea TaxID=148305 RepID=A0A6P8AT97_PYRGI|nr:uncharacterized protein PgNI_09588 [Pyricularia grisea]TLD05340.1 hypothetical protein PgNI_09588 [Pyricularia grisea]